ncbi:DNA-binding transcriptional regulator, MerR family [Micromonospora pattaloongensis]|uniref:DNA-binding transcriptional regulator, MerR family n=1 Tax=Micromonospora pattaloongensis TaxID=405436 RepID=A0A1H3RAS7_9ACTN|nr:TipAS antibiotic-recognition domain-containing protein [Micromonospora pattaloongensis]SDZ22338.1 DNA-binding transcriptional regulator, MerR family [Micromonospora pattaloongensis]
MEWSIQELARAAGTTSRTLRHYGQLGLLPPTRIGRNGYRYYDRESLLRLQRILLLRELGLGLPAIAEVLDGQRDTAVALRTHVRLLEQERQRLARQIESVTTTLRRMEGGEQLMAEEMFDGFDHTRYAGEVTQRWGRDAWEKGDRWWRSLSDAEKKAFQQQQLDIAADYGRACLAGRSPESDEVQAITRRHVAWLSSTTTPTKGYLVGLGEMYVADPRFTANYDRHGAGTAVLVRDAMKVYAERHLRD